ncbi:MAG: hypothetical protein FWF20_04670 [Betaproteobacteria bacterium]|nr:hypothetical protein [Betaproteobacteria bacterium]
MLVLKMEALGWLIYGLFLVGPYIAVALLFVFSFVAISKIAFRVNKKIGIGVTVVLTFCATLALYRFSLAPIMTFNAACDSGIGEKVYKNVRAHSYVLNYGESYKGGYINNTDATFEDAILNVANKKIQFVELQDLSDLNYAYASHASRLLNFRVKSAKLGYFRLSVGHIGDPSCAWLMPEDVKPLAYHIYISYGIDHELNLLLKSGDKSKECISVNYVERPSAGYAIDISIAQPINNNVVKHQVQAIDRNANSELIGEVTAYEYKTSSVYASVAFWMLNNKRHSRCPMNPLEGRIVRSMLNIG